MEETPRYDTNYELTIKQYVYRDISLLFFILREAIVQGKLLTIITCHYCIHNTYTYKTNA